MNRTEEVQIKYWAYEILSGGNKDETAALSSALSTSTIDLNLHLYCKRLGRHPLTPVLKSLNWIHFTSLLGIPRRLNPAMLRLYSIAINNGLIELKKTHTKKGAYL